MKQDVAIRKRQQIAQANKMMFIWVSVASVIIGASLVSCLFFSKKIAFNNKVISAKNQTVETLKANNEAVPELVNKIRLQNTSEALGDSRAQPEEEPLQVILDALPADANSAALGASLQEVLLKSDGVNLTSLNVDLVSGAESSTSVATTSSESNTIGFTFVVSVKNLDDLRGLLTRLERSIRAIKVNNMTIEMQQSQITMTVTAEAFYQPSIDAGLKNKVVNP